MNYRIKGTSLLALLALLASCTQQAPPQAVPLAPSASATLTARVAAGSDDAEEQPTGAVDLTSSDLELVFDGSRQQVVGLRFNQMSIPRGATITQAYVQFTVDEATSSTTNLLIRGQAADNAATFTTATNNVSSRPRTAASVSWAPPAWTTVGAAGAAQQTPDLKAVVQEIVGRSGWASGNSLALVITGTGKRVAASFSGAAGAAPQLYVAYSSDAPPTQRYSLSVTKAGSGSGTVTGAGISCGSDCSESYDAGTQVTLSATPAQGSSFAGWSGACTGTGSCTVSMNSAKTVTATFNQSITPPGGQGSITAITQINEFATGYSGGDASGSPLPIPSTDPAGIVYHPLSGHLFLVDSEIEEISTAFTVVQANVFETSLTGGTLYDKFNITTTAKGKNREPVGIAYCRNDDRFYISHDNTPTGVWRYNLTGGDLSFEDQVTTPKGRDDNLTDHDDPEDLVCDPSTGLIYVINGAELSILVYRYDPSYSEPNPGPSARVSTTRFRLERTIDLVATAGDVSGIPSDPEGITFDPVSERLFVTSAPERAIFEYTTAGVFIKKLSMGNFSPRPIAPQGITIAPASDGSGRQAFYIADGGVDNNQNDNERDGRVYEAVITRQ